MKNPHTDGTTSPSTNRCIPSVGLLVILFWVTGCATSPPFDAGLAGQINDRSISYRVNDALDEDPIFQYRGIHVETVDGIVELRGFAKSYDQMDRAGNLARTARGVRGVANNIAVQETTN